MRTNRRIFFPAEVIPESILAPLDFAEIFGRVAPLEVDLGCGDGTFLAALATRDPERDFIGVERLAGRWRAATRKVGDSGLTNARILRMEILHALRHLFPRESVSVLHLLFPDPWPKRRHHARRIFSEEFLRAAARALVPNGELRVATDHADYFREMERVGGSLPELFAPAGVGIGLLPTTTFEERYREDGAPIHRLSLRKISSGRR